MDNIFSFEHPQTGIIRIVILDSETCSLYFAVKDFVPFITERSLNNLKGCLFHSERSLREHIVPVEEMMPILRMTDTQTAQTLAMKLDRYVLPEVRLLCYGSGS